MNLHEEMLILSAIQSAIKTRVDDLRHQARRILESGDQKRPTNGGLKLGSVSLPPVEYEAHITDEARLLAFVPDGDVEETLTILGADFAEVIPILLEHAPHLVTTEQTFADGVVSELKSRAVLGEIIPGITLVAKPARLTIRPSKEAKARAVEVLEAGRLSLEVQP